MKSKEDILASARKSLENLNIDYVDCFQLQGAISCEMVKDAGFHEAVSQLKQEGKVKFCGVACHGSYFLGDTEDTMENILLCSIDDGRFDLILVVYNFLSYEQGESVLKAAKRKNIATTVMKSNPVKMYNMFRDFEAQAIANNQEFPERYKPIYEDFKRYNEEAKAYLKENNLLSSDPQLCDVATKFVLNNPNVDSVLVDFQNFNELESHIKYAGESMSPENLSHLRKYNNAFTNIHCRLGCNVCESACPNNVPVNTIMRYNYYFTTKGQEKYAMKQYNNLPGCKPDVCFDCEGYCEKVCPYGVITRPLLTMAHQNLSLNSDLSI